MSSDIVTAFVDDNDCERAPCHPARPAIGNRAGSVRRSCR
jgi:hypothetical protein